MSPLVTNEQTIKRPSDFLKLTKENSIVLKSNVYQLQTHWIEKSKKSTACLGKKCVFCTGGNKPRHEYYYFSTVNDESGIVRIPASVFFDMNALEAVITKKDPKKDKRNYSWTVLKDGEGRETRYTVSKDDPVTVDLKGATENNARLEKVMTAYEKRLAKNYDDVVGDRTIEEVAEAQEPKAPEEDKATNPEDIPF